IRSAGREVVAAVAAMPIVLPPTVLGFYLLVALGPNSPLMVPFHALGIRTLAFTFTGLVIGSLFYSLPFAVQPLRHAFEALGDEPIEAAATLGAGPMDRFWRVALPLSRRGYMTAAVLVFAHTVGEFGVVLMIGGAIPGRTEVISTLIYQRVETLRFGEAAKVSGGLIAFAFVTILCLLWSERRAQERRQ
ncbi:MAG: molybdate transporter, inner rane subunit, partial [Caulobacteraceae bacterium]|nr:molybdate transporter, inner rane subunit [Caulobacteraceae bacterium]